MERERYFNAIEFKDIKGIIYNSAKQFATNTAFILKHKKTGAHTPVSPAWQSCRLSWSVSDQTRS